MLLRVGDAPSAMQTEYGRYADWFERAWGAELTVIDGRLDTLPEPQGFAAIVVSGSPASLVDGHRQEWVARVADYVRSVHAARVPLLGVCFGHQLLAFAFGARVVRNPRGWEIGTCTVRVRRADALFDELPDTLEVNQAHQDIVDAASLPAGVTVLADNDHSGVQSISVGETSRGVQFHPEIDGRTCRGYVALRSNDLPDSEATLGRTIDTPHAVRVMQNFKTRIAKLSSA